MTAQYIILILHSASLGWAVYMIVRSGLYRPFGVALALDSLAGIAYYATVLYFAAPGHVLSIYRSGFQAAIWFAFGLGLSRRVR